MPAAASASSLGVRPLELPYAPSRSRRSVSTVISRTFPPRSWADERRGRSARPQHTSAAAARKVRSTPLASARFNFFRRRVAFGRIVSAVIILLIRAADLRLRDDAVASQSDEIVYALPPFRRVRLEKARQPVIQFADDVRSDGMIEHRGG